MRIYLSGAISNDKNFKEKFEYWKNKLKEKYPDAEIVNPVEIGEYCIEEKIIKPTQTEEIKWHFFMLYDLYFLKDCTHIFFIPEDFTSVGKKIEKIWSQKLKIKRVVI